MLFIVLLLLQQGYSQTENYFGQNPPGKKAEIFAPGIISLEDRYDQNSTFTPSGDEFCFTVTNSGWTACKIMYSQLQDGTWSEPTTLVSNGWDPFFSPDGENLFFSRSGDLYVLEKTETGWENQKKLDASINGSGMEWSPAVSNNGTLYYFSRGPNCIYKSKKEGDAYPSIEKLASPMNDYHDQEPFIAPDESYLIFTSDDRKGRIGTSDLFISFNVDNHWSEPVTLGPNVNSQEIEFCPYVSPDGKYFFFSRRKAWTTSTPTNIYWADASFIDSLKQVVTTDVKRTHTPTDIHLYQNFPNPFNPKTTIKYSLNRQNNVTLKIYNLSGQEIDTLVNRIETAGEHEIAWQPKGLPSAVYFCRLHIGKFTEMKKLIYQK